MQVERTLQQAVGAGGRRYNGEELSREEIEERSGMLQEEISKEKIRRGVGKLKKGKAEIVCGISGELLKAGGEVVIE